MVIDALIEWLFGILEFVFQGIPSSDPFTQGVNFSFISDLNYFLPITEMFSLFISFFVLGGPLVASSLIIWVVVGILRGGSTKA